MDTGHPATKKNYRQNFLRNYYLTLHGFWEYAMNFQVCSTYTKKNANKSVVLLNIIKKKSQIHQKHFTKSFLQNPITHDEIRWSATQLWRWLMDGLPGTTPRRRELLRQFSWKWFHIREFRNHFLPGVITRKIHASEDEQKMRWTSHDCHWSLWWFEMNFHENLDLVLNRSAGLAM
jgi:hypothetical protein